MEELVFLDLIDPNPWQPREREDPAHIEALAASIKTDGLFQAPVGRRLENGRVQLAFGHSRLAAFKLLRSQRMDNGFARMPVAIREMTDEEMFRQGVAENIARKNLTPIEEAIAMTRFRDVFGKTSAEIGQLFGMGDSGVRNKMRLLKLPEDIQDCLRRGEMAEGVARELLAISELPEDARLEAEDQDEYIKPSEIIEAAKSGTSQKAIAEMVSRMMARMGERKGGSQEGVGGSRAAPTATPPWMSEASEQAAREYAPVMPAKLDWAVKIDAAMVEPGNPADQVPDPRYPTPKTVAPNPSPIEGKREEEGGSRTAPTAPAIEATVPAKTLTWAESTITLNLQFWPEDGNPDGRMVMVGARLNEKLPVMRMHRESVLGLNELLTDLLQVLKVQNFGGE